MARRIRRVVSRLEDVVHEGQVTYGQSASGPERVAALLRPLIGDRAQETFAVLLLDGRHRVAAISEVHVGTTTVCPVHPVNVFGDAVRLSAAAIVVAHNHPSGDPEPSEEDLELTLRLIDCGKLLGIPVLDHLVIGDGAYVSLRDRVSFA